MTIFVDGYCMPFYLGGSSDIDQLQVLCRFCNAEKAINELNFRISRSPLHGPPKVLPLAIPAQDDPVIDETWREHIQRSINFYYQCAATETVEFLSDPSICEIRLRPGIDVAWIEPHLANMAVYLTEERAKSGLSSLGPLRATVLT